MVMFVEMNLVEKNSYFSQNTNLKIKNLNN